MIRMKRSRPYPEWDRALLAASGVAQQVNEATELPDLTDSAEFNAVGAEAA